MNQRLFTNYFTSCLIILFVFAAYIIQPIWDMDFWWHIASGRWIITNLSIPDRDPFGVFPSTDIVRMLTLLRAEWLGQVLLYLCYEHLGNHGIIGLRVVILTGCLIIFLLRKNQLHTQPAPTLFFLGVSAVILSGFTGLRPQLFSFLFVSITFALVDLHNRTNKTGYLIFLPFLSILWSNIHGSGILGSVLLIMYSSAKLAENYYLNKSIQRKNKILFIFSIFFLTGSFITPNHIMTAIYLFKLEGSTLQSITSEYRSSLTLYEMGLYYKQTAIIIFFLLCGIGMACLYFKHKAEMFLALFLVLMSILYYRFLPFLILATGPYICASLTTLTTKKGSLSDRLNSFGRKFLNPAVAIAGLIILVVGLHSNKVFQTGINASVFPVNSVAFLKEYNIKGKAFNHFRWGGYLLWHLQDQISIFIDGRMLDGARLAPYTNILWATEDGIRYFNDQDFDLVIMPLTTYYSGEVYALHSYLQRAPAWRLIYQNNNEYVYMKR